MDAQSRRQFLLRTAAGSAAYATAGTLAAGAQTPPAQNAEGTIPQRRFGRHDVSVSTLACGGHHLGNAASQQVATAIVHEAIDNGLTFFDNAWEYNNQRSEEFLGQALKGGWRQKAFLMTKVCTHGRDASLGMQMLEESLARLGTDHLDLWQVHAITYDNDPDLAYRKNGILEAFDKAKRQGKVRFVGFTGHKDPRLHLRMIEMGYPFDAVQMPLNAFDAQFRSFAKIVLPAAVKRGIAVLGMKPFSGHGEPFHSGDVALTPQMALRYAMSVAGVTTTITGMESLEVLRQNLTIAKNFTPMTADEMAETERLVAAAAGDGHMEIYKTSLSSDNIVTRQTHDMPLEGASA